MGVREVPADLRGEHGSSVRMLVDALGEKDPFLRLHSDQVSHYVAAVAEELGLEARERDELALASLLHDVGKIGISARILLKPGPLTAEERAVVEQHPRIGHRIVCALPALRRTAPAVLYHHERFDGGGYPAGLRGEEIPLAARLVCVADCFSAMTSERPYSAPIGVEDACVELERCAGGQFDPRIAQLFVAKVRSNGRFERPLEFRVRRAG